MSTQFCFFSHGGLLYAEPLLQVACAVGKEAPRQLSGGTCGACVIPWARSAPEPGGRVPGCRYPCPALGRRRPRAVVPQLVGARRAAVRLGAGCFAPEQRGGGCRDGSAVISASGGCLKPHSVPWGRVCHRWTVGIRARAAFSVRSRSLVSWQQEAVPAPRSPPRARNRRWES